MHLEEKKVRSTTRIYMKRANDLIYDCSRKKYIKIISQFLIVREQAFSVKLSCIGYPFYDFFI